MMKQAFFVIGVLLVGLAFPQVAQAQAKKGDKEVSIAGNLFSTIGGEAGTTSANAVFGVGYFMSDRLQIGVQPILSISTFSQQREVVNSRGQVTGFVTDRTITTDIGASAKVLRYFGESSGKIKPYFGGSFIVQSLKNIGDSSFAAASFGVKNYLTEKAALDFNGSFGFMLNDPGAFQLFQAFAGLSYIF